MQRLTALDGARGLAMLLVLVAHVIPGSVRYGGQTGLTMFFVLSGYLITSVLKREWEKTGQISLSAFYLRRGLRLLPALLMMLTLAPLLLWAIRDPLLKLGFLDQIPATLFYRRNFTAATGQDGGYLLHTWSLSLEEQFYLLAPLLLLVALRYLRSHPAQVKWALAGLTAAGFVWHLVAASMYSEPRTYYGPDTSAYALLLGCTAAYWPLSQRTALYRAVTWISIPAMCAVAVLPRTHIGHADIMFYLEVVAAFVSLAMIRSAANPARILTFRPLCWLSNVAYAYYLWSFVLVNCHPFGHTLTTPQRWGMAALSLTIATASWYLVEQRLMRWRPHLRPASATFGSWVRARRIGLATTGFAILLPMGGTAYVVSQGQIHMPAPHLVRNTENFQITPTDLTTPAQQNLAAGTTTLAHTAPGTSAPTPSPSTATPFTMPSMSSPTVEGCSKVPGGYRVLFKTEMVGGASWKPAGENFLGATGSTYHWFAPAKLIGQSVTISDVGIRADDDKPGSIRAVRFARGALTTTPLAAGCHRFSR